MSQYAKAQLPRIPSQEEIDYELRKFWRDFIKEVRLVIKLLDQVYPAVPIFGGGMPNRQMNRFGRFLGEALYKNRFQIYERYSSFISDVPLGLRKTVLQYSRPS